MLQIDYFDRWPAYLLDDDTLIIYVMTYMICITNEELQSATEQLVKNLHSRGITHLKTLSIWVNLYESPVTNQNIEHTHTNITSLLLDNITVGKLSYLIPKPTYHSNDTHYIKSLTSVHTETDVYEFDLLILMYYFASFMPEHKVDLTKRKASYLIGKLKPHRLAQLYYLLSHNVPIQYRLNTSYDYQWGRNIDYPMLEYYLPEWGLNLKEKHIREFVDARTNHKHDVSQDILTVSAQFYVPEVVNNTAFDIVSDTTECAYFLNEKVWRPIIIGRPFVLQTAHGISYRVLQDYGFRTFLEYTGMPLDNPNNKNTCVETVYRSLNLLNSLQDPDTRERIQADIDYNKKRAQVLHQEMLSELVNLIPALSSDTMYKIHRIVEVYTG